ncbi:MAG: methyl-accepting chemotaxis protein, partial [Pseudomonadota bacterium]
MARDTPAVELDHRRLTALTEIASEMGEDIVDIAGFLDMVEQQSTQQVHALDTLQNLAGDMVQRNNAVSSSIEQVSSSNTQTLGTVESSIEQLRETAQCSEDVAGWVGHVEHRMDDLSETLGSVTGSTKDISRIARQINILAVNAKIEASRAGQSGLGFAVVAEAINDLSKQTAQAANQITDRIGTLTELVTNLKSEAESVGKAAKTVLASSEVADTALTDIASGVRGSSDRAAEIVQHAEALATAIDTFAPELLSIQNASQDTASGIENSRRRVHGLIDYSEGILQNSVQLGGRSSDGRFIDKVHELGEAVNAVFEDGIARGRISEFELFDFSYTPVPDTAPQQVMAAFTLFTDEVLPDILEGALDFDDKVVFCAAVDING